jgi:tetratricopeptide (TPR) repeat protein
VVGTPAYLAPEQANGEWQRVDERADVFGLGGVLCTILTGAPPYGSGGREVLSKAQRGDLVEAVARLNGCAAEETLVALAKECLCPDAAGRPRDAGVVAQRVTAYLAAVQQRLRAAEIERAAAQARAEEAVKKASAERRARRLTLGLAATVLLLVLAGGSAAWWWQQQRQAADTSLLRGMQDARRIRQRAQNDPFGDVGLFREAATSARRVAHLASQSAASPQVRRQAAQLAEELEQLAEEAQRDQQLRLVLLEVLAPQEIEQYHKDDQGRLKLVEPSQDEQFHNAFLAWGLDIDRTPTEQAAARLRERRPAFVEEVAAALEEWVNLPQQSLSASRRGKLLALAQAVDAEADSKRRELRAMLQRGNLQREAALAVLALALRPVPVPFDAGLGAERTRLRRLVATTDPARESVLVLLALVRALRTAGDDGFAENLLRAALLANPRQVLLLHALGQLLQAQQRWQQAVEVYAALRAVRPALGVSLAKVLIAAGRVKEGLALFEWLTAEQPDNPAVPFSLGVALHNQGRPKEAEEAFREAIRLKNDLPEAHYNLGVALQKQDRDKEAEEAYRQAIRVKPDYLDAHNNLGVALNRQGRLQEAAETFRAAIRLQHNDPTKHYNLGNILNDQGRYKEAEAALRTAIGLKHDFPEAHCNLGFALNAQGRHKEAEAACREAVRLKHDLPEAHGNLGTALNAQGRHKEAEEAFRAAIRAKHDYPEAHIGLGIALEFQGRFREALAALRKGHELGSKKPGWFLPSAFWLGQCRRLLVVDRLLQRVLDGDAEPANASEGLELALLCQKPYKRLHRTAVRLLADSFATDAKRANDLTTQHRYAAACSAALAAAGQAEDSRNLPDKLVSALRHQALRWLQDDLARYAQLARQDNPAMKKLVVQRLLRWQQAADLASVRDKDGLAPLPEDERKDWQQLWADVEGLLKKVVAAR